MPAPGRCRENAPRIAIVGLHVAGNFARRSLASKENTLNCGSQNLSFATRRGALPARLLAFGLLLVAAGICIAQDSSTLPAAPEPASGSISGTIVDKDGALIANVSITCTQEGIAGARRALSGGDGYFVITNLPSGPFQLTYSAPGFAPQQQSGVLHAGENYLAPQVTLTVASAKVDVEVKLTAVEVAEEQIHVEEKQRLFGVIPNFYVSYVHDAVPLTPRQKFELAWKSIIDPVSFGITGATAGIEQAVNAYSAYGQGAQGYAKRYGASYGDLVTGTLFGSAIFPSLLKQDPRYFYKGTGSKKSRFFYAVANAVICKGDNGHWQANYSGIMGGLAAGAVSNAYYPPGSRGAGLFFESAVIGTGEGAAVNVIQEFILKKITPHATNPEPGN